MEFYRGQEYTERQIRKMHSKVCCSLNTHCGWGQRNHAKTHL